MKVYGEWFDEAMLDRARRDRIDTAALHRAILGRGHYAVRGYVVTSPSGTLTAWSMRRDGRIGVHWGGTEASGVLSSGPLGTDL